MNAEVLLDVFNYAEGGFWLALSGVALFWLLTGRVNRRFRGLGWLLAAGLAVFGVSDFFEVRSGAWWQPWWLLAVKAACVALFAFAGSVYWRSARKRRDQPR